MARIQLMQNKIPEALASVTEGLELLGVRNGEKGSAIAEALYTLSKIREIEGNYDEAIRLLKKSARHYRHSEGSDYTNARGIIKSMFGIYVKQDDFIAAVRLMQKNELLARQGFAEYDMSLQMLKELAAQQTD